VAATAPAAPATHAAAKTASCTAPGRSHAGRISGIVHAVKARCASRELGSNGGSAASDPAVGTPPLIFHGGPVMGTPRTGPLVITPIFWNPISHPMDAGYKNILNGTMSGDAGQRYNQVINGHRYLTQEEFSNQDFAVTGNGCLQNT
jgi:hypothetical protein